MWPECWDLDLNFPIQILINKGHVMYIWITFRPHTRCEPRLNFEWLYVTALMHVLIRWTTPVKAQQGSQLSMSSLMSSSPKQLHVAGYLMDAREHLIVRGFLVLRWPWLHWVFDWELALRQMLGFVVTLSIKGFTHWWPTIPLGNCCDWQSKNDGKHARKLNITWGLVRLFCQRPGESELSVLYWILW